MHWCWFLNNYSQTNEFDLVGSTTHRRFNYVFTAFGRTNPLSPIQYAWLNSICSQDLAQLHLILFLIVLRFETKWSSAFVSWRKLKGMQWCWILQNFIPVLNFWRTKKKFFCWQYRVNHEGVVLNDEWKLFKYHDMKIEFFFSSK